MGDPEGHCMPRTDLLVTEILSYPLWGGGGQGDGNSSPLIKIMAIIIIVSEHWAFSATDSLDPYV
jgi:hypothetical protein